jgi:hypothetical protein
MTALHAARLVFVVLLLGFAVVAAILAVRES